MPRHGLAQSISFDHRCEIEHSAVDPRQIHFFNLIAKLREVVRGSGDGAREMGRNRIGVEVLGDSDFKCPGCASIRGRVLRMSGRHDQRRPVRIRGGERIAVGIGIMDRRVGAPERVVILGIETRDESVFVRYLSHGYKARRLHRRQSVVGD